MSIPASQLVNVIPSVLAPGGNPLSLNAVFLTNSSRVPVGTVLAFAALEDVQDFFGPTSIEATLAAVYFAGFSTATSLPSLLYFAQYNSVAVAAYLRSGSFEGTTLAALQELSGTLVIAVNGRTVTTANIDLSVATSFSNAAQIVQNALQATGTLFAGQGTIDDGAGNPGNTLTVTVATTGALAVGDVVTGPGIAPNTTISALGTGTGGVGTYTVSGAAQDISPAVALSVASAATCTYDSQLAAFLISSATTGSASTIAYATGTLAAGLKLQAAQGAVLSQGAAAATPAAFMPTVTLATQNWATFMTTFEPDLDDKLAFAQWVQTTQKRFAYVCWDSDEAILAGEVPGSFGALCEAGQYDGIFPIYEPADDNGNGRKAAFVCGAVASIDFEQPNGRITFAFKGQAGLVADITDATTANNLKANSYNFYGAYATAADRFVMLQPGSTPGAWEWFDSYVNQIWLNSALQLAFMNLLSQINSLPYNSEGYALLRQAANDPIQQGLINGVIQQGVTLSNSQRAAVNTAVGDGLNAAGPLQNNGYYLQISDMPPAQRPTRESPPMTLWYMDGGSIQKVELSSINVQ